MQTTGTKSEPMQKVGTQPGLPGDAMGSVAPLYDVRFSPWIRRVAILLLFVFVVLPILVAFVPWQQYVISTGQVVAYSPVDRPQIVDASIDGRVARVHVVENQYVNKGDLLVELENIDELRLQQFEQQVQQTRDALEAEERNVDIKQQIIGIREAERDFKILALQEKVNAAEQKLLSAREKLRGVELQRDYAQAELDAIRALPEIARAAVTQLLKAENELGKAEADVRSARAEVESAEAGLRQARAELESGTQDANAKVEEERAKMVDSQKKVAEAQTKLEDMLGKLRQQKTQDVRATMSGRVFQIFAVPSSSVVKEGSPLVEIVPENPRQAVALFVRGVDAPLIEPGRKVRVQFEGWPAVQFVGFGKQFAAGTFGGVVDQIDARDRGDGRFRILVVPDPDDYPWPDGQWTRQGVKTKGWVLLNQVPFWYEVWRQLNGFPPVIEISDAVKSDDPAKLRSK
jgi:adhesin transport system membrane fusion protein